MTWLDAVRIFVVAAAVVVLSVMLAIAYWRFRKHRTDVLRRYVLGYALMDLGAVVMAVRVLFRLPHQFALTFLGIGMVGLLLVLVGLGIIIRSKRMR